MNRLLRKSAPLGLMTALTIWCCWTQLADTKPLIASTDGEKLPRIERDTLHPKISAVTPRDAFLQFEPQPDPALVVDEPAKPVVPEEPPVDPRAVLRSLSLSATIMGATPLSIINGRVYSEGQRIELESFPNVRVELLEIQAGGIVLQIEAQTVEIKHGQLTDDVPTRVPAPATGALPTLEDIGRLITGSLGNNELRVEAAATGDADVSGVPE